LCHVLIIEDDALIALHIQMLLEEQGATSFAFAATQTAAIREAKDRRPDLICSDVALLEGDGPHAVEIILHEIGPTPIIFITATPEGCLPCDPPAVVLSKPVSSDKLSRTFHRLLDAA
jgi:CheY-like chemotaxis protein